MPGEKSINDMSAMQYISTIEIKPNPQPSYEALVNELKETKEKKESYYYNGKAVVWVQSTIEPVAKINKKNQYIH